MQYICHPVSNNAWNFYVVFAWSVLALWVSSLTISMIFPVPFSKDMMRLFTILWVMDAMREVGDNNTFVCTKHPSPDLFQNYPWELFWECFTFETFGVAWLLKPYLGSSYFWNHPRGGSHFHPGGISLSKPSLGIVYF